MDFQQKAEALAALCELSIKFREKQWRIGSAEPWYVQQDIYVHKKGSSIDRGTFGNGCTPEEAILNHWHVLVPLDPDEYLIVGKGTGKRRAVKWNGFMWEDYPE